MDNELLKTVIGPAGVSTIVITLFTLAWKLWGNYKAGTRAEDMDDAEWNAAYKRGAERHVLGYDVPVRQALLDMQHDINNLRQDMGQEQKRFPMLPDPRDFPLFPSRDGDAKP